MTPKKATQSFIGLQGEVSAGRPEGECTPAELVVQCDVHPNQIQDWKKRLLEGAADVFGGNAVAAPFS